MTLGGSCCDIYLGTNFSCLFGLGGVLWKFEEARSTLHHSTKTAANLPSNLPTKSKASTSNNIDFRKKGSKCY